MYCLGYYLISAKKIHDIRLAIKAAMVSTILVISPENALIFSVKKRTEKLHNNNNISQTNRCYMNLFSGKK